MTNGDNKSALILVVDDIPDTLDLLANWLELHNFSTVKATSGKQALDMAAEHRPDLILLDVMMPKMDGIETCRQLKASHQTASIPIILVTAKDPSDARAEGMIAGATDYITKPVNLQDLTTRVENALSADRESPVDVQRLLEEISHTALAILGSAMVWVLSLDTINNMLISRALVTNSGSREETQFLLKAGSNRPIPEFSLDDTNNPLCSTVITRQMSINIPLKRLQDEQSTQALAEAIEQLQLNFISIVPLIAAGKTAGVMALGNYQLQNMESPRARQILASFGSQAATALEYSRLMNDLDRREDERQSEQAFRKMILDTMSDALVVINSRGSIKYVNRRMLRMSGYPPNYLEGRIVGDLFHSDDRQEIMTGLLAEKATTMKFEQRLITYEQKIIPVLLSRSRSQSLDNQVIVLTDQTDQKERERDLQEQAIMLERQTSRLKALNKAAQVIAANLSLHETLKDILHSATQVVEAQGASLFLLSRENNEELVVVAAVGYRADDLINLRVPMGKGLAGWVARNALSQLVTDLKKDERFYTVVDEQTGMDTESLIAVPLIHAEEVIGVIEVVNKLNDEVFDEADMQLLESMAGTAAVSIVNTRLFDEAQRRVVELGTLLDASEAASSTLDFSSVLNQIARSLTVSLKVEQCIIMSWNGPKNELESLAEVSEAAWAEDSGPVRTLERDSVIYTALATGRPAITALHDVNISESDKLILETTGMFGLLAAPVRMHGMVVGLAVLSSNLASYTNADVVRVAGILETWQYDIQNGSSLSEIDSDTLDRLIEQLMAIGKTCWVTLQTGNMRHQSTHVVCEVGFAEWTRRAGARMPLEHYPIMREVIKEKHYQVMTLDLLDDNPDERNWLMYRGGKTCLMVPLVSHGQAIGIVMLMDVDERAFDGENINLAQGIANVVSNAMENARLYQSLESRAKALESAYEELKAADEAKDAFIRNISHELRTPLMHALGYAELMADETFGPITSEQREALRTISEKGHRVGDIVADMVSAHAQEDQSFERQPADIVALLHHALEANEQKIRESELKLIRHFPPNVPAVLIDAPKIIEAFEKLLDNALKFGRNGERIEIMVRDTDGPMVQVAVRDYGIGIDSSEHEKIFQRFYQVDGSATRTFGGTGLGLAVAKLIIEGHSGKIGVKSRLNEGSIFFFTLPKNEVVQQA
jgi:PAS domain S-box-containing protein